MRDNILAQLEETLRMAEQRMERMAPEERDEMLARVWNSGLVQLKRAKQLPELAHDVVPKAQQEFIAPDMNEAVMPEIVNSQ